MEENIFPIQGLQVTLNKRPDGLPIENDFEIRKFQVETPKKGEILIETHYLSADPFQRMRLNSSSGYGKTINLGETIKGRIAGKVIISENPEFSIGDFVEGMLGWKTYAISDGSNSRAEYAPGITKIDLNKAPISAWLGILGFPGITAYFSLIETGKLKKGNTVVVSAAAGAVGSIVGQIAKISDCKVIGITGSERKVDYLINKLNFKFNDNTNIIHGFYLSKSSNIPRYDRLTLYSDDYIPKYSEWYYGPNYFLMNKIQLNNFRKTKYFDAFKLIISHQKVKESRHDRKFEDDFLNNRNENVDVAAINLDFDKKNKNSETFYGYEFIFNNVKSEANKINIINNLKEKISTRYPDNGTEFYSNSIYISNKRKLGQIFTNIGLRASNNTLKSILSNEFYDFPYDEINLNTSSFSGNIGFRYNYKNSSFKFQYSNGFRSPNLDDVGKIFDSEPGNIIIPNANLKPEYVNNFEVNYEISNSNLNIKNSLFYIRLSNAIIRGDGNLNGNDSIIYDGVLSRVQQLNNGGKAYIYGFSNTIRLKISDPIIIENSISYSESRDLLNDRPLRHTPPLFGKFSFTYSNKKHQIGYFISYNGKKQLKNFSVSELNKLYLYTDSGSPSWITHNFFYKFNYNYFINFDFGIDNIFDIHYRTYSSGISAPGRNIRLGLNLKF